MPALADDMLTVQEAAVVAGVGVRAVNDAIDSHVIPTGLFATDNGRRVAPEGCVVVTFYTTMQATLTRDFRIDVIDKVSGYLLANTHVAPTSNRRNPKLHARRWSASMTHLLRHKHKLVVVDPAGGVSVDLQPFARKVKDAAIDLEAAVAMVTEDEAVMHGLPCIRDTRILVHDVAASVRAGLPMSEVLEAYPDLTEREVQLAELYARAHPPRGRPRRVEEAWPDARLRFEKTVPRGRPV
jgi:uncharacterized protein (DUF433 family)